MDCPPAFSSEIGSIKASELCLDESTWIKLFEEEVIRIFRTLRSFRPIQPASSQLEMASTRSQGSSPHLRISERVRSSVPDDCLVEPIHNEIIQRVDPSILNLAVGIYLGISPRLVEFTQICSAIRQVLLKMVRPQAKRRRNVIYRPYGSTSRVGSTTRLGSTDLQMASQPAFEVDLEKACQEGLITSDQLNAIGLTGDVRCRLQFFPASLNIMSSSQPQISLRDHLMKNTATHPANDQNGQPDHPDHPEQYGQIFRFHEYYSKSVDGSKPVQELAHPLFMAIYPTSEDFQESGLIHLPVNVEGQYQPSENPWTGPNVTTSTDLNTVPGVVKEIRAGWARPDRIDSLEVDYVGDFTMSGYICRSTLSTSLTDPTLSTSPTSLIQAGLNRIALEILSRKPELD